MSESTRYANATKATWRGWAWNQLASRMGKSYKYSPKRVIVLAGDSSGDMPHAFKHRVECIAVDSKTNCVEKWRDDGGVGVCDSLKNQVCAIQPSGVIGDFVCGVTPDGAALLVDCMAICDAVVFNFLRGRDRGIRSFDGDIPHYFDRKMLREPIGNHRGKIAVIGAAMLLGENCGLIEQGDKFVPQSIFDKLRPSFYSYKSKDGGQFFDSVAVTTKGFILSSIHDKEAVRRVAPVSSRRKAAAAKAVLTAKRKKD